MKYESVGQFEQLVMTAILSLRDDAYGVSIHSKIEELARPKPVSLGAVYVTLDRLEDKGLLVISAQISERDPYGHEHILPTQTLALNPEQATALEKVTSAMDKILLREDDQKVSVSPLPSNGRGRRQGEARVSGSSPSPIGWERAGVRVSAPQNPKLFLHES